MKRGFLTKIKQIFMAKCIQTYFGGLWELYNMTKKDMFANEKSGGKIRCKSPKTVDTEEFAK